MTIIRSIAAAALLSISAIVSPSIAQETDPAALLMAQQPIMIGDLVITQAWARATPPGAPTAAGYLAITNNGGADDRLLSVTAAIADTAEIHEMIMTSDRMMMRSLEDGLAIAAGETTILQPGGFHLMFVGIGDGVVEGTMVDVEIAFANAGTVTITLVVFPIGSLGPAAGERVGGVGGMGM